MAAIDKLYTKYYSDARNLVAWLSNKRPSMLEDLYSWTFNEKEFNSIKDERYNESLYNNTEACKCWELDKGRKHDINKTMEYYKSFDDFDISRVHQDEEVDYLRKQKERLKDKDLYISEVELPIARFTLKQDTWLKWYCPLGFIRDYLKGQCGVKEHWYYKLFFKY
jgi:hypothetical protein